MERTIAVASETSSVASLFKASPPERREPVRVSSALSDVNPWIALAAALLLHAAILGPLVFNFDFGPDAAPPEQEIPVEVVVEQPKPPPPPPQAPPPAAQRPPIDLTPAHDAPRTASDDKTPPDGADAKTNGEKAPTPAAPQTGAPAPPGQEANAEATAPETPAAAAKDDDGEMKSSDDTPTLAPLPATAAAAPPSQSKVATLMGQPLPTWSKDKQFSTFEPVPDVQFGTSTASPIGGGGAKTTYLTIVYGLVMKHLRIPPAAKLEIQNAEGVIDFTVDGHGDIGGRSVVQPSGSNGLDAAALEAVREAAPYPQPPMGIPIGLKFTYGGK